MLFNKIVVPVDFSDHSEKALEWALTLAQARNTPLVLCHVIARPPMEWLGRSSLDEHKIEDGLRAEAEKRLQAQTARQAIPIRSVVVYGGPPATEICRLAEEEQADLIVMGTQGKTGLSHLLMGSVAERVVRHAPCPVLTVRVPTEGNAAPGSR
ncbi:MAG: universal stress protein [Candidatus Binatia bacterium]